MLRYPDYPAYALNSLPPIYGNLVFAYILKKKGTAPIFLGLLTAAITPADLLGFSTLRASFRSLASKVVFARHK